MTAVVATLTELAHAPLKALVAIGIGLSTGLMLALALDYAYRYPRSRTISWPPRGRLILLPAASATLTVLAWSAADGIAELTATTALVLVLLALASTDFERHLLPNRLIYPAVPLALLLAPWLPAGGYAPSALGALLGFGVMLVPYIAAPRAIGAGDVKLAALIGAFSGAGLIFPALTFGAIVGAVVCLAILVQHRERGRTRIAYGPYLVLGALLVPLM